MRFSYRRPHGIGVALAIVIGAVLIVPQSAYAWWPGPRFAIGIRVPLVVPFGPPVYGPLPVYQPPVYQPPVYQPPAAYYPPLYGRVPIRVWIPPHYTPRGVFIPGHFVYR